MRVAPGLARIASLLDDPTITEIMINGPGAVWIERDGALEPQSLELDATAIEVLIESIVGPLGLRVDRTAPFVDARLGDGSRVHIAVPPLAIDGPYVTIRRFRHRAFTVRDFGTADVAALLAALARRRISIVVSGGTGAGKTSLLNALAAETSARERLVTIEDAAELRLGGDHVVRLEARPANAEGVGGVSVRQLVRNALRMRPDRIIVGEVRGPEAVDMVQAMHTGHDGSMSTCHANSPSDALRRLEAMVLMSDVDLPAPIVRDHIASGIGVIVHVGRAHGGAREVSDAVMLDADPHRWLIRASRLTDAGRAWLLGPE